MIANRIVNSATTHKNVIDTLGFTAQQYFAEKVIWEGR